MSDTLHAATPWVESRPILAPARTRGSGALSKALGIALLALALPLTLSLATWSSNDPSLTHLSTAKPTNLLGAPGAIVSDLLITSLGLASLLALLPLYYWACQLLTGGEVTRFKLRALIAPVAVLALAACLSSLPRLTAWPLPAGFGGLLGDMVASALTGIAALVVTERAGLAGALAALGLGVGGFIFALGLSRDELSAMVQFAKRPFEPDSTWVSRLKQGAPPDQMPPQMSPLSALAEPSLAPKAFTPPPLSLSPEVAPQWTSHHGVHAHGFIEAAAPAPVPPPLASQYQQQLRDGLPPPAPMPPAAPAPVVLAPVAPLPPEPVAPQPPPPRLVHRLPPTSLLPRSSSMRASPLEMSLAEKLRADRLRDVLADFAIQGDVRDHITGPVVTTFVFEPQPGTRTTRILSMTDEIARHLGVAAVRIQLAAGRSTLLIEVPHDDAIAIGLRDLVEHELFASADMRLPLALGATARGEPVIADLRLLPSLLLAGQDADARTAALRGLVTSLACRQTSETLMFAVADTSSALGALSALPHCGGHAPAVGPDQAMDLLTWAASEIDQRTLRLRALAQSRSIEQFNARCAEGLNAGTIPQMPYLVVVLSDLSELTRSGAPALDYTLQRLVRDGAAAGVFVLAATSRVDDMSLPDEIKACFPTRLALKVAGRPQARAVLGEPGAEDLLGQGDALALTSRDDVRRIFGGGTLSRLHLARISLEEAHAVTAAAQPILTSDPEPVVTAPLPRWRAA